MRKLEICVLCGKEKELHYRFNNTLICRACYKSKVNKKQCSICHNVKRVDTRKKGEVICRACDKRSGFIREFLSLPLLPEAVLFIARGIWRRESRFLQNLKYAKKDREAKKKLIEVFAVMNEFSSGQRILVNFIRAEEREKFSQIIY